MLCFFKSRYQLRSCRQRKLIHILNEGVFFQQTCPKVNASAFRVRGCFCNSQFRQSHGIEHTGMTRGMLNEQGMFRSDSIQKCFFRQVFFFQISMIDAFRQHPFSFGHLIFLNKIFNSFFHFCKRVRLCQIHLQHTVCHTHQMAMAVNKCRQHGFSFQIHNFLRVFCQLRSFAYCLNSSIFHQYRFHHGHTRLHGIDGSTCI